MNKRIMSVFCIFVLIFCFSTFVFAENEDIGPSEPPTVSEDVDLDIGNSYDGIENDAVNDAEIIADPDVVLAPESDLFSNWYCSIEDNGNSIYLTGKQYSFYTCDQMKMTIILQKWNGTSWVDFTSFIYFGYNTSYMIEGRTFSLFDPGYYYRLRTIHYAKKGSQTQTVESVSPFIFMD